MNPDLNDLLYNLIESSSFHGLSNFFRSKRIIFKLWWLILFTISSSLCSLLIFESIKNYLEFEVMTQIRTFKEQPSDFPVISICNLNPFVTNDSISFFNQTLNKNNLSDWKTSNIYINRSNRSPENNEILKKIDSSYKFVLNQAKRLNDSDKKKLGLTFDQMFISCFYGEEECFEEDFVWFYDHPHGNCFRFNSGKTSNGTSIPIKTINHPGKDYGLRVELFVGLPNLDTIFFSSKGVFVSIDNVSFLSYDLTGFDIPIKTESKIAIEKQFVKKLVKPYSECDFDHENKDDIKTKSNIFRIMLENKEKKYLQDDCFDLCIQEKLIQYCNCYDISMYNYGIKNKNACLTIEEFNCVEQAYLIINRNNVFKNCSKLCPLECQSVSYEITISSSYYPTKPYYDILKQTPTIKNLFPNETFNYEIAKDTTLKLNIFYKSMKYTSLRELEKMNLIDLLSEIGGTMGLFLGISTLSFFELVEVIIEFLIERFHIFIYFKKFNQVSY